MNFYLNILYITIIVTLINDTGFWEVVDNQINKKFRFHHLPHIFHCSLCGSWWLSVIYMIISHNISIFNIMICLMVSYLSEIISPFWRLILEFLKKIIDIINKKI